MPSFDPKMSATNSCATDGDEHNSDRIFLLLWMNQRKWSAYGHVFWHALQRLSSPSVPIHLILASEGHMLMRPEVK